MSLKYHLMVTPGKRETIFLLASLGIGKIKVVAAFSKTAFLFSHLVFCSFFFQSNTFHVLGVSWGLKRDFLLQKPD